MSIINYRITINYYCETRCVSLPAAVWYNSGEPCGNAGVLRLAASEACLFPTGRCGGQSLLLLRRRQKEALCCLIPIAI